ncbi:F-box/LRR-repeat protein At3g03360 [Coffea arabica]|uniref:F-box/LRR-repeat protein At3g03360 n=1 Tax=Coffea arabica TaxID=13443 RepID=A0A6P6XF98_COFAR|nr:uncharacterized protein LOC113742082 [Coffea arabica]
MESGNEVQTRTTLDDVSLGNFSRLPESMIHHICSFLSARDVARTSILSKAWYCISAIYSYITLHFTYEKSDSEDLFGHGLPDERFSQQVEREHLDFLFMIEESVRECLEMESNVLRVDLHIDFPDINLLAPRLDGWISLVLKKNIKDLLLCVDTLNRTSAHSAWSHYNRIRGLSARSSYNGSSGRSARSYYSVPQFLVLASCLKVLSLSYCAFESSLEIKLPQLQRLSFRDSCFVGRSLFERFLCGCPVIECVKMWSCKIDKLLSIPNLPRLEYFECVNCAIVDIIRMDAANLQKFYFGAPQSGWPKTIDWATCNPALKEVIFNGKSSACIDVLSTVLSQLPFIETLELHDCMSYGKFKISSQTLKRLVFKDCSNLSFAQIDAPNLELLECVNCDEPFLPISASHHLQVHFSFVFGAHSVEWLLTLKAFVKKLKHWEDLKLIVYPEHQNKITDELQIEGMIIHDKLSKLALEKLEGLGSNAGPENQLIRCEVGTSEAVENSKDQASSSRSRTSRITFKWKYDASQQRFIL